MQYIGVIWAFNFSCLTLHMRDRWAKPFQHKFQLHPWLRKQRHQNELTHSLAVCGPSPLNRLREVLLQLGLRRHLLEPLLESSPILGDPHGVRDEGQQTVRVGPIGVVLLDGRLHLPQDFFLGGGRPGTRPGPWNRQVAWPHRG